MGVKINEKAAIRGRVTITLWDVNTGKEDIQVFDNLIVNSGRNAIAGRLAGDVSVANRGEVTWGAVGTGENSPAGADTTLQTELFRKVLAFRSVTDNKATLRLFLNTSEGNGVLKEFGLFGEDASSTPNSGTLINRVNIDRTKTISNTLTIETVITVG